MRRLLPATIVAALLASLTPYEPAIAASRDDWSVIAHRGFPGTGRHQVHTENSLAALKRAQRVGAPVVEVDLMLTVDDQLVVTHDDDLTRTTTCVGERTSRLTLEELLARCRGRVRGEHLLVPRQVLRWASAKRMNVVLDLKDNRRPWTPERLTELDALVRESGMSSRVTVMSFRSEVLALVEQVDPALETEWIVEGDYPGTGVVAGAADVVNLKAYQLSKQRVRALHAAGVRVVVRRANAVAYWRMARAARPDGLLTDRVADYLRWLERH